MRDFFVDHSQIHWRSAKGTFRHAVMEDTACSGSCCSASWRKNTHFSFVQCPNSSGVSSRQLLFKVKICHTAVTQCTHASKIAWSFAPSHILGPGPCATTQHAPLQERNRTWRLAQRPISLGMYLSLLLWHASVLSWVSNPISGGKSDRLRQFFCVSRGMLSASFCRARFSRAGTSPRRLALDQRDPARTGDPLVVLQVQNREVREQPDLLWHYLRTFGARALRHALRRTRPRCALVQRA
jgi:hypothetical protein